MFVDIRTEQAELKSHHVSVKTVRQEIEDAELFIVTIDTEIKLLESESLSEQLEAAYNDYQGKKINQTLWKWVWIDNRQTQGQIAKLKVKSAKSLSKRQTHSQFAKLKVKSPNSRSNQVTSQ